MNGIGKYLDLANLTREVSISKNIYDSAINALSTQTKMDIIQDFLDKRDQIEKSLIFSIDSTLDRIPDRVNLSTVVNDLSSANNAINSLFVIAKT